MAAVTPEPQVVTTGRSRSSPAAREHLRQGLVLFHRAVGIQDRGEGQVEGSGHVAGPQARAGLGGLPSEPVGGAGIQNLGLAGQGVADAPKAGDLSSVEIGREAHRRSGQGRTGRERTALRAPFRQPAVQHMNGLRAHHAEHPPGPGGRASAQGIIDDDGVVRRDPQIAHLGREPVGGRQHVRQVALLIRYGFQVEDSGTRYMTLQKIDAGVASVQMPAGVEDPDGRVAETGGKV